MLLTLRLQNIFHFITNELVNLLGTVGDGVTGPKK